MTHDGTLAGGDSDLVGDSLLALRGVETGLRGGAAGRVDLARRRILVGERSPPAALLVARLVEDLAVVGVSDGDRADIQPGVRECQRAEAQEAQEPE